VALDWKAVSLAIAVPCGGGIEPECMRSVIDVMTELGGRGASVSWDYRKTHGLARARGELALAFARETGASHLLMVDSDLEFRPDVVVRLLELDVPIAGLTYRAKAVGDGPVIANKRRPSGYVVALGPDHAKQVPVNGAVKVAALPGGCLLLTRSAVERMLKAFAHLRYLRPGTDPRADKLVDVCGIFDEITTPQNVRLNEDVSFGLRASKVGLDSWLLLDAETVHHGRAFDGWAGNYLERWHEQAQAEPEGGRAQNGATP
jgi:hypothetical protein